MTWRVGAFHLSNAWPFVPHNTTPAPLSIHPSPFLGFLSRGMLQVQPTHTDSLFLPLVGHLGAEKTIGSNLVSLSFSHSGWVSRANQQLYLWPAEENLGDPISSTHTGTHMHMTGYLLTYQTTHRQIASNTYTQLELGSCVLVAKAGEHMQTYIYVVLTAHLNKGVKVWHTHTHKDSWQAEIVTKTSGSAAKTEIGPEYSLSLDGARLNFRDSFL